MDNHCQAFYKMDNTPQTVCGKYHRHHPHYPNPALLGCSGLPVSQRHCAMACHHLTTTFMNDSTK